MAGRRIFTNLAGAAAALLAAIRSLAAAAALLAAVACGGSSSLTITADEAAIINGSPEVMRVLTVESEADLAVLRDTSRNFSIADLSTPEYAALAAKMITTLEACDGGVGLAAPQVGINRRVVAVMRTDKEGEPIEVYPNLRIVEMRGEMVPGGEGCLSIPDRYGEVERYRDITIVYTDISSNSSNNSNSNSSSSNSSNSNKNSNSSSNNSNSNSNSISPGRPREIREDVKGFAAVIFQHEADHLDGVLYTDKLDGVLYTDKQD